MGKLQQRARRYEKEQARKHSGKAKGGPGQPDYTRGSVKAEVKNWQRPVHSGVVKKARQNGVTEIVSSSRFTEQAIDQAKKAGITLIHRGKRIT